MTCGMRYDVCRRDVDQYARVCDRFPYEFTNPTINRTLDLLPEELLFFCFNSILIYVEDRVGF